MRSHASRRRGWSAPLFFFSELKSCLTSDNLCRRVRCWLQFLTRWSPERKGNGYVSALLIGASSGLIVGPCTAPALGAVLAFVGTQGSVAFGTSVLFVFALGMGVLMIALGTFGGVLASLPRSGEWMVRVKKALGYLMILLAQYLLLQAGQCFV